MKKVILPICFAFLVSCGGAADEEGKEGKGDNGSETPKVEAVKIEPCYSENFAEGMMIKKGVEYTVNINGGNAYATLFNNGAAFIVLTDKDLPESPDKTMFDKLDQAAITIKLSSELLENLPHEVELGGDNPGYQIFYSQLGMNDYLTDKTSITINGVTEEILVTGNMLIEKANENQVCITADLVDPDGQKLKFAISTSVTPR